MNENIEFNNNINQSQALNNEETRNNGIFISKPKKVRVFNKIDKIFAIIMLFLTCLGVRAFPYFAHPRSLGWGVTLYTFLYLAVLYAYAWKKGVKANKESKFFTVIAIVLGTSFTIAYNSSFNVVITEFLRFTLMYLTLDIFGTLIGGSTGKFIIYDMINMYIMIPLSNFVELVLNIFSKNNEGKKTRTFLNILLGIIIAIPVLFVVVILLSDADIGFKRAFTRIFTANFVIFLREAFKTIIFAIIPASYMYGLMYGSANKKGTNELKREALEKAHRNLKKLPIASISVLMILLISVYAMFIFLQGRYYFNIGTLPEEFTYSEYARKGFFELLTISIINICVITGIRVLVKNDKSSKLIKVLNALLSILTILLIANALMRMSMYISTYGLTIMRVVPSLFMIFLIIVFVMIIVAQFKNFELLRYAVYVFFIMLSILSVINIYEIMANYNLNNEIAKDGRISEKTLSDIRYYDWADVHYIPILYSEWNKSDDDEYKKELFITVSTLYSEYRFESKYTNVDELFVYNIRKYFYKEKMHSIEEEGTDKYDEDELYFKYDYWIPENDVYDNYDDEYKYDEYYDNNSLEDIYDYENIYDDNSVQELFDTESLESESDTQNN